ncbi:MAG: 3-deoxy-8-phosphooctulonate synthase [Acidobacteria bacterium]|nr:3-deoxy-8-phosphooctulonate synthase [Acidobacteriota bacterium]
MSGKPQEVVVGAVRIGGDNPVALIGGPCAIENEAHALHMAEALTRITGDLKIPFIYQSSYDKANRSSVRSYRGPGLTVGLRILSKVRESFECPVLSDVHLPSEVGPASECLDILQIPAFLCRQTDLLVAAAKTGRPVNVKKGQFLAPWDMKNVVEKFVSTGNDKLMLTERGTSFGYGQLVVDFRSLVWMRQFQVPVVFDATHSVQLPGGAGDASSGNPEFIEPLARAAVAVGVSGLFMEVHDNPKRALSDGSNALQIELFEPLVCRLLELEAVRRGL